MSAYVLYASTKMSLMSACPEGSKERGGGVLTSARLAGSQERRGSDVSGLFIHKRQRYLSALEREHGHRRRVINLNRFNFVKKNRNCQKRLTRRKDHLRESET